MLRVLEGQFLRDILAPAGVVYDEILHKSRWAHLDNSASGRLRKHKHRKSSDGSFRWGLCQGALQGALCTLLRRDSPASCQALSALPMGFLRGLHLCL